MYIIVYIHTFFLSLSFSPFICFSVYFSMRLTVSLSVRLSVCVSLSLSRKWRGMTLVPEADASVWRRNCSGATWRHAKNPKSDLFGTVNLWTDATGNRRSCCLLGSCNMQVCFWFSHNTPQMVHSTNLRTRPVSVFWNLIGFRYKIANNWIPQSTY